MNKPSQPSVAPINIELAQLRLMTRAARLHHIDGEKQTEIADRLGISQAGVSRLLRMAEEQGIIRKIVVPPDGLFPEIEERLMQAYGLKSVYVVDENFETGDLSRSLGLAAARLLPGEISQAEILGFTSWSSTLREMARHMQPIARSKVKIVAETLGDLGSPILQHEADVATLQVAQALGAEPAFLRAPGVCANAQTRQAAEQDVHLRKTLSYLEAVDIILVGLGPVDFHGPLSESENFFNRNQLAQLREQGAVGQLHQRFIDHDGKPIATELDERVIGISLAQLRAAKKRIVVAGGEQKYQALLAALAGGWVDVLLTDLTSAEFLLQQVK